MHRRFAEPGSDFLTLLTLWDYLREQQRQLSSSAFRRLCRREYLHYLRVREWQDVYSQLQQAARDLGILVGRHVREDGSGRPAEQDQARRRRQKRADSQPAEASGRYPADLADRVHQSLLAGLLSHIGMQEPDRKPASRTPGDRGAAGGAALGRRRRGPVEFAGARGARFAIFPDSPLARKPPQWVMAAELVETSRLWARTIARIEPEWAESLAGDLVRRSYSEPHWDARRGAVMAAEKVTLYGLPIVAARQVNYGNVDPTAAREMFIQHALVEGDWQTHSAFLARNQFARQQAEELEHKARRRGLVADDRVVFDFYDARIPKTVTSARHFDSWWKKARHADPGLLDLTAADLAGPVADEISPEDYPASWGAIPLSYEFAPGEADDGVTADIQLKDLYDRNELGLSWQVPGLRLELVTELIRGLPKDLRRHFIPAPGYRQGGAGDARRAARRPAGRAERRTWPARPACGSRARRGTCPICQRTCASRYRVLGDNGAALATGKDLDELRAQLRAASVGRAHRGGRQPDPDWAYPMGLRRAAARVQQRSDTRLSGSRRCRATP